MAFELVKEIPESKIVDEEHNITMRKKAAYGPEVRIHTLLIGSQEFEIQIAQGYDQEKRSWSIKKIKYPEGFKGSQLEVQKIALESLEAYRDLIYQENKSNISVECKIS